MTCAWRNFKNNFTHIPFWPDKPRLSWSYILCVKTLILWSCNQIDSLINTQYLKKKNTNSNSIVNQRENFVFKKSFGRKFKFMNYFLNNHTCTTVTAFFLPRGAIDNVILFSTSASFFLAFIIPEIIENLY